MSSNIPVRTFTAFGNISPCRFVKQSTAEQRTVQVAGDNDKTIGIAQENLHTFPSSSDDGYAAGTGETLAVHMLGDECLLYIGTSGCDEGDELVSDATGGGIKRATTGTNKQEVGARALEDGSSGSYVRVLVVDKAVRPT